MNLQPLGEWLVPFCFGYPFVMAFYWMVGGLLFHLVRERDEPAQHQPPQLKEYPPVSVLVPCFNEELQAEEGCAERQIGHAGRQRRALQGQRQTQRDDRLLSRIRLLNSSNSAGSRILPASRFMIRNASSAASAGR